MTPNSDVTVVIPCFDHGAFLGEAVDSALAQEGGPAGVVVVDDGSTDAVTRRAYERLPPEVTLLHQHNAGVAAARNAGAAATDTSYLVMLDADDRLRPGRSLRCGRRCRQTPIWGSPTATRSSSVRGQAGSRFPTTTRIACCTARSSWPPASCAARCSRRWAASTPRFPATKTGTSTWARSNWAGRAAAYRRWCSTTGATSARACRATAPTTGAATRPSGPSTPASTYALASSPQTSELRPAGRFVYRNWWARRPLPGVVEQALYRVAFRVSARLRASSTSSAKRDAISG